MKHRRIGVNTVACGLGGVIFVALGLASLTWWVVLVGVVMLGVMAWGVLRFLRGPRE